MTLLIWKLFLLSCSPAAFLLISSSSPHHSLCPLNTVKKTCFDEVDLICLPTFTTCTVFRVFLEKTCVASLEGHHHPHDYVMVEVCWLSVGCVCALVGAYNITAPLWVWCCKFWSAPGDFGIVEEFRYSRICQCMWQWSASQMPCTGD